MTAATAADVTLSADVADDVVVVIFTSPGTGATSAAVVVAGTT